MKNLFTVLLCLFSFKTFSQHYNPTYGSPIIVLIETDPWLMVIGSDVPTFAAYQNGQIIYKTKVGETVKFYEEKLTIGQLQQVISKLGITDSLLKLPNQIVALSATDQPTNELLLNFDTLKQVSVYGNLQNEKARSHTPNSFLSVYDNLKNYKGGLPKPWLPDSVEIMVSDYSHSPEKPLSWPKEWPDLQNAATVKRSDSLYSLYLDKKYFNIFLKLLSSLKEKQAVEINGKKFSLSYRLPFPNLR